MKRKELILTLITITFLAAAGLALLWLYRPETFKRPSSSKKTILMWEDLAEMDYVSGKASPKLTSANGNPVKVPGFMIPLEDNNRRVQEFLFVPSPQSCIHVPPPPPNQMIFVKMNEPVDYMFEPVWLEGELSIGPKKHMYGEASFEIQGTAVYPYGPQL